MLRIWPLAVGWEVPLGGSLDDLCLIEVRGLEGEAFAVSARGLSGLFLTHDSCDDTVVPIDEAMQAAEAFLGPYTGDEHSWRSLFVR